MAKRKNQKFLRRKKYKPYERRNTMAKKKETALDRELKFEELLAYLVPNRFNFGKTRQPTSFSYWNQRNFKE